ncbi:C-8 sterol isomerase [Vararia minispora EC-137]|uniref:C-8 sterol isomerase n=1 Tax=Vararia minispora EC-137 TaxID=1314806 RepID=A0ACB8QSJ5_9AGAM|nr:C-8 sterol isomerase [Vararia minispora EC-137]
MAAPSTSPDQTVREDTPIPHLTRAMWRVGAVALLCILVYPIFKFVDSLRDRFYVFDPPLLHDLARSAVAAHPGNTSDMVDFILANLTATYPGHTVALNTNRSEFFFNVAGGAMGVYLFIFGTPLGTEGHTGILTADDYFHILEGEQWAFAPGSLGREIYRPGDVHLLPRGTAKQYKMPDGCFALEYARGWIPLMVPFGIADTFSSTLDVPTLWTTARVTVREMVRNLRIGKI